MVPLVFREEVIDPGWDLPKDMEGRIQPGVSIHNKIQRGGLPSGSDDIY
jgi:hypothetical protein